MDVAYVISLLYLEDKGGLFGLMVELSNVEFIQSKMGMESLYRFMIGLIDILIDG